MEGIIRGFHRHNKGRNRFRVGGVRGTNLIAHTPIHGYTRGKKEPLNKIKTRAVGKRPGNFLTST